MIIQVWDYFMRRKGLLLTMLALLCLTIVNISVATHNIVSKTPKEDYIHIQNWGTPEEVEIPHTGGEALNVLPPQVVAEMIWTDILPDESHDLPEDASEEIETSQTASGDVITQSAAEETLYVPSEEVTTMHQLTLAEFYGDLIWLTLGVAVVILLGYLVHQHFRR